MSCSRVPHVRHYFVTKNSDTHFSRQLARSKKVVSYTTVITAKVIESENFETLPNHQLS